LQLILKSAVHRL